MLEQEFADSMEFSPVADWLTNIQFSSDFEKFDQMGDDFFQLRIGKIVEDKVGIDDVKLLGGIQLIDVIIEIADIFKLGQMISALCLPNARNICTG